MKTTYQRVSILPAAVVAFAVLVALASALPAQAQTIQVLSADPPSASQGTINLNVSIKGKGFKNGAQANFYISGTTNPGGIVVHSTTFKGATEVVANIDVTDEAVISKFDILVKNSDGRTGKGTELFTVTSKQSACPAVAPVLTSASSCTETLPGCLDETFGGTGVVLTDTDGGVDYVIDADRAVTPLLQPDGKIVAVGISGIPRGFIGSTTGTDIILVRYNPDGTLDASFGSGGIVRDVVTNDDDGVEAAALQPDGKILVAGGSTGRVAVARFNPDGTLDSTFGAGGHVLLNSPKRNVGWSAPSLALQPDGRILLGTYGYGAVVRLRADGSMDSTFGVGGFVRAEGTVGALTMQRFTVGTVTEERILAAVGSTSATGGQNRDFLVMRLMPNGAVDTSFGASGTGKTYTDFCGGNDGPGAIAVDAAGNIVVAGTVNGGIYTADFGIARYTPGGIRDSGFGDLIPGSPNRSGRTRVDFLGSGDQGWGVAVQPDGKLVVSGNAHKPDPNDYLIYFALARFNPDGTLDTSFGTGGVVAGNFSTPAGSNFGRQLVLDVNGRIIVVGGVFANETSNFAVARYWP